MRFLYAHRLGAAHALSIEYCGDSMNGSCKPDGKKHCCFAHSLLADHPFLLMMVVCCFSLKWNQEARAMRPARAKKSDKPPFCRSKQQERG